MTITATPITPKFGAEITGVDFSQPISPELARELIALQDKWGVTVYRGTGLDDERQIAFSRHFGHLERLPERLGLKHRELFSAGNLGPDGQVNMDPAAMTYRKGDMIFHSDSSFIDQRSAYSMLLCHEAPSWGAATWFADTRSAYEDLPQAVKDQIENLECEHSLLWSRKQAGADISHEQILERHRPVHKLVHVHAGSGRKVIYAGSHCYRIAGKSFEESRELIDMLNAHVGQEQYTFPVYYKPGDMSIWDNLCTNHRGSEWDWTERRDMRRTTVREAPAPEGGDDPFGDLLGAMPAIVPVPEDAE